MTIPPVDETTKGLVDLTKEIPEAPKPASMHGRNLKIIVTVIGVVGAVATVALLTLAAVAFFAPAALPFLAGNGALAMACIGFGVGGLTISSTLWIWERFKKTVRDLDEAEERLEATKRESVELKAKLEEEAKANDIEWQRELDELNAKHAAKLAQMDADDEKLRPEREIEIAEINAQTAQLYAALEASKVKRAEQKALHEQKMRELDAALEAAKISLAEKKALYEQYMRTKAADLKAESPEAYAAFIAEHPQYSVDS